MESLVLILPAIRNEAAILEGICCAVLVLNVGFYKERIWSEVSWLRYKVAVSAPGIDAGKADI